MSHRIPTPRCKRVQGRKYAVVTLPDGAGRRRDVILGRYGTSESKAEYVRVIAEWQAADHRLPETAEYAATDLTINELLERYLPHIEQHYRHADGTPTNELA